MQQVNLLQALPQIKRNIQARQQAKSQEIINIAKQFGKMYFDGPRKYGYGGYIYDGRWLPVAKDIIDYFNLRPGYNVLDVGCAKGFLVKDLMIQCPGLEVFGLDISDYALLHCEQAVIGRLHKGSAINLPFPDKSFDLVLSINTLHNFPRQQVITALSEIERVSKGASFIQVDSYYTPAQKKLFEEWVLTAEFHDYPHKWLEVFKEANYTGDYFWTVVE